MIVLVVSVLAAVLPTALYVCAVWWLDRYEKEPMQLLGAAFLWGAVPGVLLSVAVELVAGVPTSLLDATLANVLNTSFTAPVVEELVKACALLTLFLVYHREFDGVLDGIVYGAVVGFGFGMTENVLYFLSAYDSGGLASWGQVVFLRTAVFGLNHALYTATVGAGLGLIRYRRDVGQRVLIPLAALVLAITLHGVHNLFAQVGSVVCWGILVSLASDWAGVLVLVAVAVLAGRHERQWITLELADEVKRGTLTVAEYRLLQSSRSRLVARLGALTDGGWRAYRHLGTFFHLATELAFRRYQAHAGDANVDAAEIESLRRQIGSLRS